MGLLRSHCLRFEVILSKGILRLIHFVHSLRMTFRGLGCYLLIKCSLFINFFSGQVSKTTPVTLSDQRESKGLLGSHYLRFKVVLSKGILRRTHFVRLLRMTLLGLGLYFKYYSIFTHQKIISTTIPSKPLKYIRQALPFIAIIDI